MTSAARASAMPAPRPRSQKPCSNSVSDAPARPASTSQLSMRFSESTALGGCARSNGFCMAPCLSISADSRTRLELPLDQFREVAQQLKLSAVEISRPVVDNAKGAGVGAVFQRQGCPRVEADAGLAGHQWIVGKSIIRERILHVQHVIAQDGMSAEG